MPVVHPTDQKMSVACVVPSDTGIEVHTIVQPKRIVQIVGCELLSVEVTNEIQFFAGVTRSLMATSKMSSATLSQL